MASTGSRHGSESVLRKLAGEPVISHVSDVPRLRVGSKLCLLAFIFPKELSKVDSREEKGKGLEHPYGCEGGSP